MSNLSLINVADRHSDQMATAPIGWDPALVQAYLAEGIINPNRVVVFGAASGGVLQGSAAAGLSLGVYLGASIAAIGDQVPVAIAGIAFAQAGGTVTRGQKLSGNASGQVITALTTTQVIGIALESGVNLDLIPILIVQSTLP